MKKGFVAMVMAFALVLGAPASVFASSDYDNFAGHLTANTMSQRATMEEIAVLISLTFGLVEAEASDLSSNPESSYDENYSYISNLADYGLEVETDDVSLQFCRWIDIICPESAAQVSELGKVLMLDGVFSKEDAIEILWQLTSKNEKVIKEF